jgi:hypothetical protein
MKKRKNLIKAVIEIDDVEYLIDEFAAKMVEKNSQEVVLIRLFDKEILVLSAKEIKDIIKERGVVDFLD